MWPMKLDMTRDECRGVLRRLELESYSSIVSTFRAQGGLCKEKARILEDLRRQLHISQDRHKAEARRVANDEKLTTVAELISGPNTYQDWCREGRRTFPILPRTTPYTALTYIANTVCEQISRQNAKLPHPFETCQNRLEKEQEEEEKRKLLEEKQQQQLLTQSQPQPVQSEVESTDVITLTPPLEPNAHTPKPVVTEDPFVEAANKSYINDLKRSYPIDPISQLSGRALVADKSPVRKKPQLYQELQKQEPLLTPNPIVTFHHQPPQSFSLQQPLSPHKSLASPTNFGTAPSTSSNINNNVTNNTKTQGKSGNKSERSRKTPASSRKNQNKSKTPYQANKQSNAAGTKASKNAAMPEQPLLPQQQLVGVPASIDTKTGAKNTSANSPHLIHSYASPLRPHKAAQHGGISEISNEPLQLQKHLTSNITYQSQQSQQSFGMSVTAPLKSPTFVASAITGQQIQNIPSNLNYSGQQQLLPSSKKDIQYNLTKLNPTNNVAPMKNNLNIPLKQSSSSLSQGKTHPLLNYQKKSPSKNVLIPTSSATAAALASLGIPKPIQRKDNPLPVGGKFQDVEQIGHLNPADIPNPKIVFSTAGSNQQAAPSRPSAGSQITILDQITLHPPNTPLIPPSTAVPQQVSLASSSVTLANFATNTITPITPISVSAPLKPIGTTAASKIVALKGPNLAGFTPVKGGNKLSVHKLQLVPIGQPGGKNNVIVLPAKTATALNPGQKITIPKSVIDTSSTVSPPKVIVQQQPDLNNIVVLDIGSDQQKLKATNLIGQQQQNLSASVKSVITEDTPVDIVTTPLDVVTGAVKLQELSKGFHPMSAAGSPLTEKMVKPQPTYSSSTTIAATTVSKYTTNSATKTTKFEADSTASGPSLTVTRKTKTNHRSTAAVSASPSTVVQSSKSTKLKPTAAVASSTTTPAEEPPSTSRASVMSTTDWELELDQANQITPLKTSNVIAKAPPKPAIKPKPAVSAVTISKPVAPSFPASSSSRKAPPQPLSSSSISSTSSSNASKLAITIGQSGASSDTRIAPPPPPPTAQQRPTLPLPTMPLAVPTSTPKAKQSQLLSAMTTTSPNERSDDTSATDSADAEEDPEEGIGDEEDDDPIEEEAEEMIIVDEHHFNAVIEEEAELDEAFNEQELDGERVEIVNVGYETSRALIADLEDTETAAVAESATRGKTGAELNPSTMNFEQFIVDTEGDTENGPSNVEKATTVDSRTAATPGNGKNIMFEMLEIDAEGNKHTRTLSYEEALAEGQLPATEALLAGSTKGTTAGGLSSGSGTAKSKTKPHSQERR
ncbi:BRCA2-interacting transcriptional repressor EMSY [Sabethes cyaneus]|uniref:BRCA2-interacting transcriptional repressor EMSY n=1 Tax=Sabethes cyaneus TaxID=53552 RepID=UPI00237D4872|nr:BRCA2-interacting transcriptional repressor EMSY [Sabethes cyaneus]